MARKGEGRLSRRTAIIIGAGPAGLTAAYELLDKSDIKPIVFEASHQVGGISRTVDYKGNKMDIGGHRFFSKSDRVMEWWTNIFPLQGAPAKDDRNAAGIFPSHAWRRGIGEKERERIQAPDPEIADEVMLIRRRISRIMFEGRFFDYPVSLGLGTLYSLGAMRTAKVAASYARARLFPIRSEQSLEDFLINRFGRELYRIFFKDYTEKVWGVPCSRISPEWGAQRIKGLSVSRAVTHAVRRSINRDASIAQKDTETSLIEQFLYPKYGPGQFWGKVSRLVEENGGEIQLGSRVVGVECEGNRITGITTRDESSGATSAHAADFFFSSMAVRDLIEACGDGAPPQVAAIARGLVYREFITVGLLLRRLGLSRGSRRDAGGDTIPDNWIYIQESDLKVSRLQLFNNWSPYLVQDPDKAWVGLEYICGEEDELWSRSEEEILQLAREEMCKIGDITQDDILDGVVVKMPKVYPAYFGTYDRFDRVRAFTDAFENLFLIGRNGMHRYNNQDHSMLSAMVAVENIMGGIKDKSNIWSVNIEEEYHESR